MTKARDVMHLGAECVDLHDTLQLAAQRMRDLDVGALPVYGEDDRLHGIITDRDIVIRCVAAGSDPSRATVRELVQGVPFTTEADADINTVLQEMQAHRIRRLPVMDNHRLVGMISEADLARHLPDEQVAQFVEAICSA